MVQGRPNLLGQGVFVNPAEMPPITAPPEGTPLDSLGGTTSPPPAMVCPALICPISRPNPRGGAARLQVAAFWSR